MIRMDHPDLMKQIRIIWQSPLIPNGPIPVSNSLPADFKAKVVTAIKKLDKDDHQCFIKAMGGKQHIGDTTGGIPEHHRYEARADQRRPLIPGCLGRPNEGVQRAEPLFHKDGRPLLNTDFAHYYQRIRSKQSAKRCCGRSGWWCCTRRRQPRRVQPAHRLGVYSALLRLPPKPFRRCIGLCCSPTGAPRARWPTGVTV